MVFDNYNHISSGQSTNEWINYPEQSSHQENGLGAEFALHLRDKRSTNPGLEREKISMNQGSIADIQLDKSWELTETEHSAFRKLQSFSAPGDSSTTISFHESQMPVNAAAAQSLKQLFGNYSNQIHNLSPEEIRSIAPILDRLNAGDNQHTNSGESQSPVFHLDHCRIQQINGKPVLQIDGNFIKADGTPGQALKGILMSGKGNPQKIQAIAFEAANKQSLLKHQAIYDSMMNSIKW